MRVTAEGQVDSNDISRQGRISTEGELKDLRGGSGILAELQVSNLCFLAFIFFSP